MAKIISIKHNQRPSIPEKKVDLFTLAKYVKMSQEEIIEKLKNGSLNEVDKWVAGMVLDYRTQEKKLIIN